MKQRAAAVRIGLALAAALVGWLLVEVGARARYGSPFDAAERVLLVSLPYWETWGRTLRHAPDRTLRSVAIFGDRIEYDVRFRTNEMGLIDDQSYAVLFISGDFQRNEWVPVESGGRLSVCPPPDAEEQWACEPMRILGLQDRDAGPEELLALVRASGLVAPPRSAAAWFTRATYVGAALRRLTAREEPATELRGSVDLSGWLARIGAVARDREVTFVQLPERQEALENAYRLDPRASIEKAGYRYVPLLGECELREEDYFAGDGHLDAAGYERLIECVGSALGIL